MLLILIFFSESCIWLQWLNVVTACQTITVKTSYTNSKKMWSIFLSVSFLFSLCLNFRLPKEYVNIFADNFCMVIKLNRWYIKDIFIIRHKRQSQRETEYRSVSIHAVKMVLISCLYHPQYVLLVVLQLWWEKWMFSNCIPFSFCPL